MHQLSERILVGSVVLGFLVVVFAYVLRFFGYPLGDPSDWGGFGDYVGGMLNPLVALVALVLLARGINLQRVELAEAREAINAQSTIMRDTAACDALLGASTSLSERIQQSLKEPRQLPYWLRMADGHKRAEKSNGKSLRQLFDQSPFLADLAVQPRGDGTTLGIRDVIESLVEEMKILERLGSEIQKRGMEGHMLIIGTQLEALRGTATSLHMFKAIDTQLALRYGADVTLTREFEAPRM